MKILNIFNFIFLLLIVLALQPSKTIDKKCDCVLVEKFYKNHKLVKTIDMGNSSILYGDGISNSHINLMGKKIDTDSISFSIKK